MTTPAPTSPNSAAARQKLTIARAQLLLNKGHGFWGVLALRLGLHERPDIKTLAVDGKRMFYNADFVMTLSDSLCRSAIAHEVMHCVFEHVGRRGARNPRKWNQAGDFAINLTLKDAGFEIGQGWLLSDAYRDMSADQIYDMLPDSPDDDGNDPLDEIFDGDPTDQEAANIEWKLATVQAAQAAKKAGNLPGALDRFVEEITTNKVDWREQLKRYITQISKDDYAWSRPNRRFLSAGAYLPGLYSENMGDIVVAIDTSGSIDQRTLDTFGAEVKAVVAAVRPTKTTVIYCDSYINHVDEFGPHDELRFKLHGGGGTDFNPPFQYVDEQGIRPECLIYLTDLYGPFPPAPQYPTIWVATTNEAVPFGEAVRIEV